MADADDDAAVLRIGVAIEELGRVYPWLDGEAAARNMPGATVHRMHVALEEAVMNAAMHAYGLGAEGHITIRLRASPDTAALLVEDDGPAFDPTAAEPAPRAASLEEAVPGGLGLTLLRHFCGDIGYERIGDRNRLTMRFPLSPA
jgi:anti-sigma regulatory factor (Ser/Thr protein kinase)